MKEKVRHFQINNFMDFIADLFALQKTLKNEIKGHKTVNLKLYE